jgi:hypothetical protein
MTSQLAITHPFEIVTVAKNIVNLYKQNMKRNIISHEKEYCKSCRYFESDQHHNLGEFESSL